MNRLLNAVVGAVVLYGISEILTAGKNRKIRRLETKVALLEYHSEVQDALINALTMDGESSKEA